MAAPDPAGVLRSPLHDQHVAAGAKFAAFGGWSMPLEYAGGGVLAEHAAVRTGVGVFDVSHLGKATVSGPGAAAFVNRCLTNDLARIVPGQAQYTLLCDAAGGVVDDLIAYLHGEDRVFLVPNAANAAAVVSALRALAPAGIEVRDQHREFAVLAVQGPAADQVLATAGLGVRHGYMSFAVDAFEGTEITVCRTGYTGERGYELVVPVDSAVAVWTAVLAAGSAYGLRPAGLGARDTLRTEMGYPLHGQDLTAVISPVQARLGWAVGWDKPGFVGDGALRAEREAGPARILRGLRAVGRGIPRPGMRVHDEAGVDVGVVTSGTYSPTLRTGIALALVTPATADGDLVGVHIRSRREPFRVTRPPFVATGVREP